MDDPLRLLRRLIHWARFSSSQDEIRDEVALHREMIERDLIGRGHSPEAAHYEARRRMGNDTVMRENARAVWLAPRLEACLQDVRYALRSLRRSPAFTAAAILTVALGVAASTALFSVVNATLLRPLPIPRPGDFVYVGWVWPKGGDIPALTSQQYEFIQKRKDSIESVASFGELDLFIGAGGAAQSVRGLGVAGDFFDVIGFTPRLGRAFSPHELKTGEPVVILGHEVWRTRFSSDSGVIGRQVNLAGKPYAVIGVMPEAFRFPPAPRSTGYLLPTVIEVNPADEGHNTMTIGRLRHDLSGEQRAASMRHLTRIFRSEYPSLASEGEAFRLYTSSEVSVGAPLRQMLWTLLGAVMLVLLIACANTATLLMVRAHGRQREIAVRASLGASPRRILQQLSTEAFIISITAAGIGVALSVAAVRAFLAVAPNVLPIGTDPGVDPRVLAFAIAVATLTGLAFGLIAAAPAFRARLQSVLGSGRAVSAGNGRIREALVFLETSLAVVLLCGATVLATSFSRLVSVDVGFDAASLTAVRLGRLPPMYSAVRRDQLATRLLERARALPGVDLVALAPSLPFERGMNFPVDIAERPDLAIGAVELRFVSPAYLRTLGVSLKGGRDFEEADLGSEEPIAIVNEAFAKHFWGGKQPVGRSIQIGHYKDRWVNPRLEHATRVIGVAADIREAGLSRPPRPTVLVPRRPGSDGTPLLLARGQPSAVARSLRALVVAEDPQLSPVVEPLSAVRSRSVSGPRFRALLIGSFAGFAVLLAGIGIYGVLASVVQQRRKEIGLRLALGADQAAVVTGVVRRCLIIVGFGAVAGLALFWASKRVLATMVFEISPGDPLALATAVGLLGVVAALASWIPARRAARTDPVSSLRSE